MIQSEFDKEEISDVKIYIGAKHEAKLLSAHSFVLSASSSYFHRALRGELAESKSRKFTFDKENPHTYWRVFEYMYTGDYSDEPAKVEAFQGLCILLSRYRILSNKQQTIPMMRSSHEMSEFIVWQSIST